MPWIILLLSLHISSCHAYRWPNKTDLDRIEEILPAFSKLRHVDDPPREKIPGKEFDYAIKEFLRTFMKDEFGRMNEALDKFGKVSPRLRNAFAPIVEYIRDGYVKLNTTDAKEAVLEMPKLLFELEEKQQDPEAIYDTIETKTLALPDDSRTGLIASYKEFFQILKERKRAIGKPYLLDNFVESYKKYSTGNGITMLSFTMLLFAMIMM